MKSKVSNSLTTGNPAARMRAATALAERVATSSSVSFSRYASYASSRVAASRANFSNSASIVGSLSCLRLAFKSSVFGSVTAVSFRGAG